MNTKALLIVTALIEAATSIALVAVPSLTAEILLGEGLDWPQAVLVARVAGVALLALSFACWLARNGERSAQSWLSAGMLVYNIGVPLLLLHGWFASSLHGLGLWPACLLHTALAICCVVSLRPIR